MFQLKVNLLRWVAWVPGIDQCGDWAGWSTDLALQHQDVQPDLSFIPPVVRRRLSRNSRLAIRAAHDCLQPDMDVASAIFCSRHGECQRTLGIYGAMANGEDVSPIQFSQSVHNAASGIFSIERQLRIPVTSIAAGPASGEQGFIEAFGLIEAGLGPVLWVMSDDRPSAPFDHYVDTPAIPFAMAMVVGRCAGKPELMLSRDSIEKGQGMLNGVNHLLALLTGQASLGGGNDNGWRWHYQVN